MREKYNYLGDTPLEVTVVIRSFTISTMSLTSLVR